MGPILIGLLTFCLQNMYVLQKIFFECFDFYSIDSYIPNFKTPQL